MHALPGDASCQHPDGRPGRHDAAPPGLPGVISGNQIQVPIDLPINACDKSIDIVGLLNPSFGNTCTSG
ncbi:chaplin [Amycolatopsis cihanbeyliensis]|uniref:Small secreted domain DUF320 n=1 Tax=Amycolatopsis cihanbeyliensis TaxID=1128664 RepID=A0A542DMW7_AMYCI|nr:chaplin [Amycolatopsis cihanbeyliensis]TQJ04324.1 small secreted domain DUF320 [Amycolatopsis cihanbeyliensis]